VTEDFTSKSDAIPPQQRIAESLLAIRSRDWKTALEHARQAAGRFEEVHDAQGLFQAAILLEKLGRVVEATRLLSIAGRLQSPCLLPEWAGGELPGKALVVVQRIRDIGAPIRQARAIAAAAGRFERCVVLASERLVPLLRRSFPGVDVLSDEPARESALSAADVVASYETLVWRTCRDDAQLASSFRPLVSDPDQVSRFVDSYGGRARPRIGISWFSTNQAKDVPPIDEWARLMKQVDATFVSLQYGDMNADRALLQTSSGSALIHDEMVDQLRDMDRFAAQVAAMDVVVTISNTLAQLSGALGVRTIVILDDKVHLIWPLQGEDCVWYPRTTLLHRMGREWPAVFDQVQELLQGEAL